MIESRYLIDFCEAPYASFEYFFLKELFIETLKGKGITV
jgi:hypothetical protein